MPSQNVKVNGCIIKMGLDSGHNAAVTTPLNTDCRWIQSEETFRMVISQCAVSGACTMRTVMCSQWWLLLAGSPSGSGGQ